LSEESADENIVKISKGEQRRDIRHRYTSNCTRRVIKRMDMWVQELMMMVKGEILTLTYTCARGGPCGAIEPNVALESTEKASLGLSSRDGAGDVGALVLVGVELVAEAVLNLVRSIAEDVISLLVLEVAALIVLDLKMVAFF